jgi:hypothetical protein
MAVMDQKIKQNPDADFCTTVNVFGRSQDSEAGTGYFDLHLSKLD